MESETGACIEIRGKGRKDRPGGDEPLHVNVTSTNPEAVKKAVDKIRNIIRVAVDNKDSMTKGQGQNDLRRRSRSRSPSSGKKGNLERENTFLKRKLITISHQDSSVIKRLVQGKQNVHTKFCKYIQGIREITKLEIMPDLDPVFNPGSNMRKNFLFCVLCNSCKRNHITFQENKDKNH